MKFSVSDVGLVLNFPLVKPDGTPFDLTGCSAQLIVKGLTPIALTIATPTNGRCAYTVAVGIFSVRTYVAQVRVTKGAIVLNSKVFKIDVAAALP